MDRSNILFQNKKNGSEQNFCLNFFCRARVERPIHCFQPYKNVSNLLRITFKSWQRKNIVFLKTENGKETISKRAKRYYYRIVFRDTSIFLSFFPKESLIIDCVVNDKALTFYNLIRFRDLRIIRIAKRRLKRTLASLNLDYYYRLYCVTAFRELSCSTNQIARTER